MNIKIKASGVACMVGDDYDRVYKALVKSFGEGSSNLFSKRVAGHEYLQWEIPGDGWRSLSEADPFMGAQVKTELARRREAVISKFGSNRQMAFSVLSVPSDEYVYYKADSHGGIDIKLTAWGYKYPERVDGGNASGAINPNADKQHLVIKIVNDGKGVANKALKLNGYNRSTDSNGELEVGYIPEGTEFDVEVDGNTRHYRVKKGEGQILFDLTQYSQIEVRVTVNGKPGEGIPVTVNYGARNVTLTTNSAGKATAEMPHDPTNGICFVKVKEETKERALNVGDNTFEFNIVEKIPEVPAEPEDPQEPEKPENLQEHQEHQEEEPEIPKKPEKVVIPEIPEKPEKSENPNKPEVVVPPEVPEEPIKPPVAEQYGEKGGSIWGIIGLLLLIAALVVLTYIIGGSILF